MQPGEQELGIHLAAYGPKGQLLVAHHSEVATNSSQKAFGCPDEPAPGIAHFICCLWAYATIGELLEARFQSRDTTTRHLLAAKILNLSLEYNFVTPLTSLVMTQPKEASEECRRQTSTTIAPGTIMTSSTNRHGLGTDTAQPGLVPKVSLKSKLVKPNFYLSSTAPASTKKMASSKELEALGQSLSTLSTPSHPRPKISAQHNSGTLAQPILRTKPAAPVPSNSEPLLLLKPSTPTHQNLEILLTMNSKTQSPPLNLGTPAQPKAGTMKHVTPLHSNLVLHHNLNWMPHHISSLGYSHHSHPKICYGSVLGLPSPNIHHTPDQGFPLPRLQTTCHTLDLRSSCPRPSKSHHS